MSAAAPVQAVPVYLVNESPTTWQLVKTLVVQIWACMKEAFGKLAAYWEGSPLRNQLIQFVAFRFLSGCFGSVADGVERAWNYTQVLWFDKNQQLLYNQMARLEGQLAQAQKNNDALLTQYKASMQSPSMTAKENCELMVALRGQCTALQDQLRTIEAWFREAQENRLRNCFLPIQNGAVIDNWHDFLTTQRQIQNTFAQLYPQIQNVPGARALNLLLQMQMAQSQITNNGEV